MSNGNWLFKLEREKIVEIEGIADVLDISEDVRLRTAAAAERDDMLVLDIGEDLPVSYLLI